MQGNKGTCLVLGGKGFIGSAIVEEAERRGYTVLSVGRKNYHEFSGSACDVLINADGNSKKYIATQDPKDDFDRSVQSVVNSLHDFRPSCYVYLSSIDVYSERAHPDRNHETSMIDIQRLSAYGFHKYMAEHLVRFYANSWLIFRMGGFVGRSLWKNSIYDILKNRPLRVHPDSTYQYLNTRDLATIMFYVLESGTRTEIFNTTGHGLVSLRDVSAMVPGYDLSSTSDTLPIEHYDINVNKIKTRVKLPQTRQVVEHFIADVLSGKETIR